MIDFDYYELLKHPKWQRKRLEIMGRDGWKCTVCGDTETELHVHHKEYIWGRKPWEYPDEIFETLCKAHHKKQHWVYPEETKEQKADRILRLRHFYEKYKEEFNLGSFEEVHPWL